MIPLISSLCYGPLEACQLPRLWWKVTLRATGLLDDEYPEASRGLDARVIEALNLDEEETLSFIRSTLPDYLSFEAWVVDKRGNEGEIDDWNAAVRGRVQIVRRRHP